MRRAVHESATISRRDFVCDCAAGAMALASLPVVRTPSTLSQMNHYEVSDFVDRSSLVKTREQIHSSPGLILVFGTGASLIAERWDLLVYADMARWEIQMRQRAGAVTNLGLHNADERPSLKYKRAFFVDWRAADRLKKSLLPPLSSRFR